MKTVYTLPAKMLLTQVFLTTLLTFFKLGSSQLAEISDRGCVSPFRTSPGDFEICKTQLCFIIVDVNPYVFLDPALAAVPSKPFLCRDHDILYSNLTGLFFDILRGVSKQVPQVRESRCIFGGSQCTFDNTVQFVGDVAKKDPSYKFVAGGYLLFLENRRTRYTIHSQPWVSDSMVILFRPENARHSFSNAWKQVLQPFGIDGWVLLLCYGLIFLLGLTIHSYRFSRARTFHQFVRWFILSKPSSRGVWETASWNSLRFAAVVFCAVLILLYELSVVNFIIQGPGLFVERVSELKGFGLENFAIEKEAAAETIFKYAVGWGEKRGKYPWVRASSLNETIKLVKNKTVKYGFSFETAIRYKLRMENLCDALVAEPTHKKDVGGWYYSSSVSEELRASIDKALSKLVLNETPEELMKNYGSSPLICGKTKGAIGYEVLVVLLALTVCPFLLKHFLSMALSYCWSNIERPDTDNGPAVAAAQEYGSSSSDPWSPGQSFSTVRRQDETLG